MFLVLLEMLNPALGIERRRLLMMIALRHKITGMATVLDVQPFDSGCGCG